MTTRARQLGGVQPFQGCDSDSRVFLLSMGFTHGYSWFDPFRIRKMIKEALTSLRSFVDFAVKTKNVPRETRAPAETRKACAS